ncbi:MAG: hypothetical protein FWD27_03515 [Coriobacteriia bacterium]|nr:hypothetical protein [Coriobacteriia bacterium]
MKESYSKEAPSYKDPIAPRVEAAIKHREEHEAGFAQATDNYDGFYLRLKELGEDGNRFFLGAPAIIGSRLSYSGAEAQVLSNDGLFLAQLAGAPAERLSALHSRGWHIEVLLSATYFRAQDKSALADIAFLCWSTKDGELNAALCAFAKGIAERFASGDRADVRLSQDQFIKILESKGAWCLTPTTKRDSIEKGTVVFKARRSGTERITAYALRHKTGCNILAILFWLALAGGIAALIWSLFSG